MEERAAGQLWSVEDLSDFLQVPVKTLYQWRLRGYGPADRQVCSLQGIRRDRLGGLARRKRRLTGTGKEA